MQSRPSQNRHAVDLLFTLALFGVFAISALLVAVLGAGVYRESVRSMDENFSVQTSLGYVSEKLRQNDLAGGVELGEVDGLPALVLHQTFGGQRYRTMIYEYDGFLRELFTRSDVSASPGQGREIVASHGFQIERLDGGLLRFSYPGEGGAPLSLTVFPRCEGGGAS